MAARRRSPARRVLRAVAWTIGLIAALVALYGAAALAGSLLPANAGWTPPRQGVQIYVYSNGIHTGIAVPTVNGVADWRGLARARDLADPRYAGNYLLFGWGERNFYLDTPTWSDFNAWTGLRAIFGGGPTLLHIDHLTDPKAAPDMRPIILSGAQYARLSREIRGYFALDAHGRSRPIRGYGPADMFYEARGRYGPVETCNEWTGSRLRDAGVRVGRWTPFSYSVMRWFEP